MTKAELTTAILGNIRSPWDSCTDAEIATIDPLSIEDATKYLAELRQNEDAADLEPDERLPKEVTPDLFMEVFNCEIRRCRHSIETAKEKNVENMVKITFLMIEEGVTYDVTVPEEMVVRIIWMNVGPGIVLTDIEQKGVTA